MKFLYLLLIGVSISVFAAPKADSIEAPIVVQNEVPNLMAKIISIDNKANTIVVSLEKGIGNVTIAVTKDTYIQFIGRKSLKRVNFKVLTVDLKISVNGSELFMDLQKSSLSSKKVYPVSFISFAK